MTALQFLSAQPRGPADRKAVERVAQDRRRRPFLHAVGETGLIERVVVVLICGVSHALVHDGVEDRVAEALDRGDGAFVGSVEGDSVDRHAGRAEEGDRCRLLRELRTTGQAELVFLCGQRVRGDLNELVVGNAVGTDDEIIAFAGAFDARFCVLLAGARELGNVEEMTRRAAIGGGLGGQYRGRRHREGRQARYAA